MFQYSVTLQWSDEDKCYIARIPELPYTMAHGDTPEKALAELKVGTEAVLEVMKEEGEAAPPPAKWVEYSGQLRLRLPKTLHARLAVQAEREGVSLNTYLVSLISESFGKRLAAPASAALPEPRYRVAEE